MKITVFSLYKYHRRIAKALKNFVSENKSFRVKYYNYFFEYT